MKLQITVEGKIYEVEVEVLEEDVDVPVPGDDPHQPIAAALQPISVPGSHAQQSDAWGKGDGERVCRSPITGLVIRVNVEAGQVVVKDELIVVLEAMKMETNVMAPGAGRVKSVHVAPGDPVKANQIIVEFE